MIIITFLSTGLYISLLVALVQFLHKVWWNPIRIRRVMASQGIEGPAYRFLHGNTKELIRMRAESVSTPTDFSSHHIFPRIMPDIHAWKQLYGIKLLVLPFIYVLVTFWFSIFEFSCSSLLRRLNKESRLLTAEVISRTAFGSSYLEGEKMFDMLMKMVVITSRNRYKIRFPGIGKFLKLRDDLESDKLEQAIRESILAMINKREQKMRKGEENNYGSDFLGSLIKANHDTDEKNRISVDDMVDECKTFYLAGQETTNGLLAWSLLLLAIHTDWQEKARKEVLELFGQQNPTAEGIARLKIMSMILNETLRLYPPVINLLRRVEREVRLGKLMIPANTYVLLPVLALHHDPEIWGQDVHLFKPERFADGVAKATNNNIAGFIPFGFGPRICVGLNFAANEAKIALSMILQRYKFGLSSNYVHHPIQILTIRPKNGIPIVFNKL